mmetsp:Transcript_42869/g.100569  ORF Transcript_42869/g.100569 Transcript_42869/m.100569 type:complete len:102 (-) Transcript_42869:4242-4547(-)
MPAGIDVAGVPGGEARGECLGLSIIMGGAGAGEPGVVTPSDLEGESAFILDGGATTKFGAGGCGGDNDLTNEYLGWGNDALPDQGGYRSSPNPQMGVWLWL